MKLRELEDKLFSKWIKNTPQNLKFIRDGVVCEDDDKFENYGKEYEYIGWNNSPIKILFLLKEANDDNQDRSKYKSHEEFLKNIWDLRDFIKSGTIRSKSENKNKLTWGNITRWSYGIKEIYNSGEIPNWKEVYKRSNKIARLKHLKSICAININKQPGGKRTDNKKLEEFFINFNKEFLIEQISLYRNDVDVIVCCGEIVGRLFHSIADEIFFDSVKVVEDKGTKRYGYYKYSNGPLVINSYHPQASVGAEKVYKRLMNIVADNIKN